MIQIRKFLNVVKTGLHGVWKNKSMGLASIISIAAVSIILGIVLIVALSMNNVLLDMQEKINQIEVYIKDEVPEEDAMAIHKKLLGLKGVKEAEYKSKEKALEEMKEEWGEDAYILEGLENDNPLERSVLVSVEDISYSEEIVNFAKGLDGVNKALNHQDAVNKLLTISKYVKIGGFSVVVVLIIISILVISNTVKLTVIARRREIEVMKYVGATNSMVSGPFIIEGIAFGLIGAVLAFIIVYYSYSVFYLRFSERLIRLLSSQLIEPSLIKSDLLIIFSTLGLGIGTVGSVFSLKKYLRV